MLEEEIKIHKESGWYDCTDEPYTMQTDGWMKIGDTIALHTVDEDAREMLICTGEWYFDYANTEERPRIYPTKLEAKIAGEEYRKAKEERKKIRSAEKKELAAELIEKFKKLSFDDIEALLKARYTDLELSDKGSEKRKKFMENVLSDLEDGGLTLYGSNNYLKTFIPLKSIDHVTLDKNGNTYMYTTSGQRFDWKKPEAFDRIKELLKVIK